jgi:hypothetical protein
MSDSRAGFAETDPGVPGAGVGTRRPRCGPGPARGQGQPDSSRPRAGWPSHRRAGRLTAENLAGSPRQSRCARGHPRARAAEHIADDPPAAAGAASRPPGPGLRSGPPARPLANISDQPLNAWARPSPSHTSPLIGCPPLLITSSRKTTRPVLSVHRIIGRPYRQLHHGAHHRFSPIEHCEP